jgi:hypothetical protein
MQQLSLANVINDKLRAGISFGMSVINVILVVLFTIRFKRKVDFVVKTTKQDSDD